MLRLAMEIIYKSIIYSAFLLGFSRLVLPYLLPVINEQIKNYRHYARLRRLKVKEITEGRRRYPLYRHLELLFQSTFPWFNDSTVVSFIVITLALAAVSCSLLVRFTSKPWFSVLLGILIGLIPYLLLRMRLYLIRSDTSYELVPTTSLFLAKYRANSRDVYHALLDLIKELDSGSLKLAFIKLTNAIQSHRSKEELERSVELFVFQIQNTWAKQLGILFINAIWEGMIIEKSLINIVQDMTRVQQILQEERSNNNDAILLGFFPLIAFPLTWLFVEKLSGFGKAFHYQFNTPTGLISFAVTALACVLSLITALLLRKPKNDL
ncbi:MAG: hypothetical protein M0021_17095 [Clostridia bacterium]|nr:hypothetical protein [Clostridia bacterium]